jgi:RNA polymerase sigma factor for flagellar operon FliA
MNDHVIKLWKRYTQDNDQQTREALILHYAGLVKYVVGRLAIALPPSLQQEDLIGYGVLGLIEAVDRFDLSRGVKFETYAVARIRGQIIDSLRTLNLLPRSAHRRTKEISAAIAHLSQLLGRIPDDMEIANYLNISLDQYRQWLLDANFAVFSLDQPVTFDDGEQSTLYDSLEDTKMPVPTQQVDDSEMRAELMAAIRALPKREQLMIALYYNDRLTMKEIGQALDVSESRVSQMHAKAMLTLRGLLEDSTEPKSFIYNGGEISASVYAATS